MNIETLEEGYKAKEWKRDNKHRVYIVGPDGEVGYFDLTNANFVSSPKSNIDFGICEKEDAIISLSAGSGTTIYLGMLTPDIPDANEARTRLTEAIKAFTNLTQNAEGTRVEINLGPTKEVKINGRSHWAKANLTVSVDNGGTALQIEELYDATSNMVSAMLDLEIEKLGGQ